MLIRALVHDSGEFGLVPGFTVDLTPLFLSPFILCLVYLYCVSLYWGQPAGECAFIQDVGWGLQTLLS